MNAEVDSSRAASSFLVTMFLLVAVLWGLFSIVRLGLAGNAEYSCRFSSTGEEYIVLAHDLRKDSLGVFVRKPGYRDRYLYLNRSDISSCEKVDV